MSNRVPRHHRDMEEGILGMCMLSRRALDDVATMLVADDFYVPTHQLVWEAITALHNAGQPVDPMTVLDRMCVDAKVPLDTGHKLTALLAEAPSTGNVAHYATVIRDDARLRSWMPMIAEAQELVFGTGNSAESADKISELALGVVDRQRGSNEPVSLSESAIEWLEEFDERQAQGGDQYGLRTGLTDLDKQLAGFHKGESILVAARPAMGKSDWLAQAAVHVANHYGPVVMFSLEMSKHELTQRIIATMTGIDRGDLRIGKISTAQHRDIERVVAEFLNTKLWFVDTADITTAEMKAIARRMKARHGLAMVVDDYVQLIATRKSHDNRQVEVSGISRDLKVMAKDLDVPVVSAAQLSRRLEERADKRPMLSDLRESGSLEQDADVVVFLYREEMYFPDTAEHRGKAELIVAKQRAGRTGTITAGYDAAHGRFFDLDTQHTPPNERSY